MKQIQFFFVLFLLAALSAPLFAQRNEIALDTRVLACNQDLLTGASLHYYRLTGARGSIGFAVNMNTTQFGKNVDMDRNYTQNISLNVVRRWNLSKSSRLRWNVEGGFSALAVIERTLPHSFFYCGVGLTAEDEKKYTDWNENGFTKTHYYAGIATGSSLLFKINKNWWAGLTASGDWFWDKEWDELGLRINPGVQVSRTF